MTDQTPSAPVDRSEDITRARWFKFTQGLSILAEYQEDLSAEAPLFFLEDVDGDEIGEPGMRATFAIANVPDPGAVHPGLAERLVRAGWFNGGTWQYRLTLFPKV